MGAEFAVDLRDERLELEKLDIGVANGIIAFDISGTIRNIPEQKLEKLAEKTFVPKELHLEVEADNGT